jgi:rhamnulokinase
VVAGPSEATALGNVLVQALGSGEFASLAKARQLIARSFPLAAVEPQPGADWDQAYARFCALK